MNLDSITEQEDNSYEVKLRLVFNGESREVKQTLTLRMQNSGLLWIIHTDTIEGCFDKPS